MIKTLQFTFGEIRIFKNFIISVVKEGTVITPDYHLELAKISETYYLDKPFVFISYRKYSYTIDPLIYLKTATIKNLIGVAVVSTDSLTISNIQMEKIFLNKPFRHFINLDDAKLWVDYLISQEIQS